MSLHSLSLSLSSDIIDSYRKPADTVLATVTAKRFQKSYTYDNRFTLFQLMPHK